MTKDGKGEGSKIVPSLLNNWISVGGLMIAVSALIAVAFLLIFDITTPVSSPYLGILTYIVAPAFLVTGLGFVVLGAILERRRRRKTGAIEVPRYPRIDLNDSHERRVFITVLLVSFSFLALTAIGTYRTYHFTESVQFCGSTCHVMKPEITAYQHSPHARVSCTQCHIGSGANWYVRSKLSGSYQVYATLANKFPRPIPTPVKNLRPAQDTCEQCHWPEKFFGSVEKYNDHYLADEQNSAWTIRMLIKIGGGSPDESSHAPAGGVHWHMNIANKVEYIHTDEARQVIPWVKVTDRAGKVTIFESTEEPLSPERVKTMAPRLMDCIDCHNRPSHRYEPPNRAVNQAMSTGRISVKLPSIKQNAVTALIEPYQSTDDALKKIEATLREKYKGYEDPAALNQAIEAVQKIYTDNFFPEMKVDWRVYPDNIGHTVFPGCNRCHDGKHASKDGALIKNDCNSCHTILAQGSGEKLLVSNAQGLEFEHPMDIGDLWKDMLCTDCHKGALPE